MNIKNNKRHQDTIRTIEHAFMDLLKEKDLSRIKVSTLCNAAGISRGTFYANYIDIYDLADKLQRRLQSEVHALLTKDNDLQFTEKDFLMLLQHIKENQALYSFYFKLEHSDTHHFLLSDSALYGKNLPNMDFHIAFFEAGFNAIVKKWLDTGCTIPSQEVLDILVSEYQGRIIR